MDKSSWWIPFKAIAQYKLGSSIKDIPNFLYEHVVSETRDRDREPEFERFDSLKDKNFALNSCDDILYGVTCWDYFYIIENNVIGSQLEKFICDLHARFGLFEIEEEKEIVYFKDGTCRVYYNKTSLGLDFATDLSNIVQYVSVSDE